jgi:hypothetical protein
MTIARLASLALLSALALLLAASGGCRGTVEGAGGSGAGGAGGAGGGADFAACDGPGQCALVPTGCCGTCGAPELSDLAAVNTARAAEFAESVCPEPIPCPKCATQPNPNLFATCRQGRCVAADARTDAVSACQQSSDCVLRYGMGCCESTCMGTEGELTCVSVTGFQAIHSELGCDSVACDACLPVYPMFAVPLCNAQGHCEVGLIN